MAYNYSNFSRPLFAPRKQCSVLLDIIAKHNNMYIDREGAKTMLKTLYGVVISFGIVENLFVIFIILSNQNLRNLRTSYIAHLAFSDLMLCVLTAPSTLWFTFNNFWDFGDLACKFVASLQAVNTFLSLLTLTAIAWDRYLLIIFPVRWRNPNKALLCIIGGVWLISLMVAAPYFFAVGTAEYRYGIWNLPVMDQYLKVCELDQPQICVELFAGTGFFSKRTFTVIIFVSQYVFPLSGLLFVYGNIVRHTLSGRKASVARRSRVQQARRQQRKTIILLTSLVVVFGVCWLPSNLYRALDALNMVVFDQFLYIYFHLFGMVTACVNPLLYGLLNSNVRKAITVTVRSGRIIFPCCSINTNIPEHSTALLQRFHSLRQPQQSQTSGSPSFNTVGSTRPRRRAHSARRFASARKRKQNDKGIELNPVNGCSSLVVIHHLNDSNDAVQCDSAL